MNNFKEFSKGLISKNPIFVLNLGLCSTLACTTNANDALGLGIATTFVLVGSCVIISIFQVFIPKKVRSPCVLIIAACFTTSVGLLFRAYGPRGMRTDLGIYVPLIVVNCIIYGRIEAFVSKNGLFKSFLDALGMGCGFILGIVFLALCRELLCNGSFFEIQFIPGWTRSFMFAKNPAGAFIIIGCIIAGINAMNIRKAKKAGKVFNTPNNLGCRHCNICKID